MLKLARRARGHFVTLIEIYGKGVIQCTQYEKMNGELFASFV